MKLKQLEQQLAEIRETLNSGRARDSLQLSSTGERRPKVSFSYERADGPGASGGVIEAGDFGNGYEALRICTSGPTRLGLESDTDALLQAAGQPTATGRNWRVVALWQSEDHFMGAGFPGCRDDLFGIRLHLHPGNVLRDGAVEKDYILR